MTKFVKVMFGTTSGAKSDFEYKLNEINESNNWNPNADNPRDFGGFNYADDNCILRWLHRGDTIYDVEIPEDAEFVKLDGATTIYRANKIKISNPQKVTDEMALEFYKKSSIPSKSYFKALEAVTIMGYEKTALAIIKDRINSENIGVVLEEWNDFIINGGDGNRIGSNTLVNKIHNILLNIKNGNSNNEETIVEIGFKLNHDYKYYEEIIKENNNVVFEQTIETWDNYYTNKSLDGLTENQMKNACIRQRNVKPMHSESIKYQLQNMKIVNKENMQCSKEELDRELSEMKDLGIVKVDSLSTHKIDYQLQLENMKSCLQFQLIDNIGLILYYDNPDYYKYPLKEQRQMLIDELNSYGLSFKYSDLGLDKLRTLYYKKEMFSKNQNG